MTPVSGMDLLHLSPRRSRHGNEDEDSDCFSMSSMDASFEMHRYVEPQHPVMRGGTKATHPPIKPSAVIESDATLDDARCHDHFDTFMNHSVGLDVDF